ncbi:MAG: [LysW]-aminoadipate kinase [Candidatus Levybacteria bacterium]|nr:[LysW]-aminoadipate kinase [Candidatus Daviesbacteria bacterium]MBI4078839.1 [LysW]-aminoadipate kinase [Candidatus Levybacteria bacterium]
MIIVKIGGGKNINIDGICQDIAFLLEKEQVVVVHGASETRDEIAQKLGIPTKTITSPSGVSSVYTDKAAIDVFLMVYCGLQNKKIVANLLKHNVNAIGLSGVDGKLWQAKRKDVVYAVEDGKTKIVRDNFTGRVEKVNADLLWLLLNNNYVPVLCPPAISLQNEIVNTDNDLAVAVLAGALKSDKVVSLFEAAGLLKNVHDEKSVIRKIKKGELEEYLQFAKGRMKKKILGAQKALANGVSAVYWGDGRVEHPVLKALKGKGTVIS